MQYHEFVGRVHNEARLANENQAVAAIRATFETLAERLAGGQASNLAAQLPQELGEHLRRAASNGERFGLDTFFERVSQRERVDLPDAVHHARVVIAVLGDAISGGELDNVRAQLPEEYDVLFEAGSQGDLRAND